MKASFIGLILSMTVLGCSHLSNKDSDKITSIMPELEVYGKTSAGGKKPTLRPPKIKIRHVDDQIKDGVFIPAHLEYEIQENARWEE